MTAQGAFIKLEGGNIMIHGPGNIEFKASKKELAGPTSTSTIATLPAPGELKLCEMRTAGAAVAGDSMVSLSS
jgi:type VI secretion system secreted protein VgrG